MDKTGTDDRFLREHQIVRTKRSEKGFEPLIPVGRSALWAGVKDGTYPPPLKLGKGTTVWRHSDIMRLIATGDWRKPVATEVAV